MNRFYKISKTNEPIKNRRMSRLEKFALEQLKDYGAILVIKEFEKSKNSVLSTSSTIPESDSSYIGLRKKMNPLTLNILGLLGYTAQEIDQEQYTQIVPQYPV